ncbi:protein glp-1-like [Antedon mediterranea]|uniref:protein glp-1-like n=1 Tax=Antedon mediterranea TaxID=105859 RepID=UPI003AF6DDDA
MHSFLLSWINACSGNLCQNGAECVTVVGSCTAYTCTCPSSFTGFFCETSLTTTSPTTLATTSSTTLNVCSLNCLNGGKCTNNDDGDEMCQCQNGFSGETCRTVIVHCKCYEGLTKK